MLLYNTFVNTCKIKKGKKMTIATFGGAGNVGKTTVLELVSQEFSRRKTPILAIDANPDQNLMSFAGIPEHDIKHTLRLCSEFDQVKLLLDGGNPFYSDLSKIVATSPVTEDTKRWRIDIANDSIVSDFGKTHNGVIHMRTGTYDGTRIGGGCMHDLIENLVYTVERLDDGAQGEHGVILIDQAHGRDAFGTPLYAQGDIGLVVVEPTAKSLGILVDYIDMAKSVGQKIGHDIKIGVIGNKVNNPEQIGRIQEVAGEHYIASLYQDNTFNRDFDNKGPKIGELMLENQQAITSVADTILGAERNWQRRKDWLKACHVDAAWYDHAYGTGVRQQKTDFVPFAKHVHGAHCNHG
jgi:CO dehydrogenase nickel-insertion accessory protein CooC1